MARIRLNLVMLAWIAGAVCGDGRSAGALGDREAASAGDAGTGCSGRAACACNAPAWSSPVQLFESDIRVAAGAQLHAVGVDGSAVVHRSSDDEGATWSNPVVIPGAGALPIYGPLAAENTNVYLLTRAEGGLQVQRSTDGGSRWSSPVELHGYAADSADRVQMDAEGTSLHIFVGRAGATADPSFKIYYWRSTNAGQSFDNRGLAAILDDSTSEPPSPGGIAVENGIVHIGYAAITPIGTLGHRARYLRSTDNGATWSSPVDVSGPGSNPQIRPRPRVLNGRVFVLWEEPLDHNRAQPYPNATQSDIRMNVSLDSGVTWQGPRAITQLPNAYENHPEVAIGPGSFFHVIYRISANQFTLTNDDPMGYRTSPDYGATWCPHEIAIDDPTQETHPVNLVATNSHVHVASANGVYARRSLRLLTACRGDCDSDGAVGIDELIRAIRVALGVAPAGDCSAADGNGDGRVTIDELLAAVNATLAGCA